MQYVQANTSSQYLIFSQKVMESSTEKLKFTSYGVDFEVTPTEVVDGVHFLQVEFSFTSAQAAYFESTTTFKVQFGSAFDYVSSTVPSNRVIQYDSESE